MSLRHGAIVGFPDLQQLDASPSNPNQFRDDFSLVKNKKKYKTTFIFSLRTVISDLEFASKRKSALRMRNNVYSKYFYAKVFYTKTW